MQNAYRRRMTTACCVNYVFLIALYKSAEIMHHICDRSALSTLVELNKDLCLAKGLKSAESD